MSDELRDEILKLALLAANGELSDEQRGRLSDLAESSDEACRELLHAAMLDADLVFHLRAEAAEDRVASTIALERAALDAKSTRGPHKIAAIRWGLPLAAAAAAAAILFLTSEAPPSPDEQPGEKLAVAVSLMAERQPEPIATVTGVPSARLAGRTVEVGDLFFEGEEIRLLEGELHVSMASGADFVLTSSGEVQFVSSKQIRLRQGALSAQVAKWGTGFTVDTDAMRVTDLGTRFAVAASGDGAEAHVLQGQVRVQPLAAKVDGRRSMLLNEGEALRVGGAHDAAERIDAERDRFPESSEEFHPFKPVTLWNTGVELTEGDEDPHWRITAGPVGAGYKGPQFGVVCTPDERYAPNEPERSQWLSVAKDLRPGGLPNSLFTFESSFDLTGFDLETVTISAQVLVDNGIRAIRINGEPVPVEPWDDNQPDQTFSRNRFRLVEVRRGFVPGVNKIEVDVWNGIYNIEGMKADPNPVSLRVEFQGFGRLLEPKRPSQKLARLASGLLDRSTALARGGVKL